MQQELTRAELEVMQILWKKEKAFVQEVLAEMSEPKPAYNTVSTVIRILERKGVVWHEAFGKSHRYYPLFTKDEYAESFMQRTMGHFFDHSPVQMFSFLAEKENLSLKEIEQIAELAKRAIEAKNE